LRLYDGLWRLHGGFYISYNHASYSVS
jgi:hypothetical protein